MTLNLSKTIEPLVIRFLNGEYEAPELALKIRYVIEDKSQNDSQMAFSKLMDTFVNSGLDLLNFNDPKEPTRFKIAGLTIFDCLIDVNDEIMPQRRTDICNHVSKLLESDKVPLALNEVVLKTGAHIIGHFARVASTVEYEFLQNHSILLGYKMIQNSRSESQRYAGALILTQLAQNSQNLIFSKRKNLFSAIWDAVSDRNPMVRSAAAQLLEVTLQVVSQREAISEYIRSALKQVENGFNSSIAEKMIGSLIILDTLVNGTIVSYADLNNTMRLQASSPHELIWKVLFRKDWRDSEVRIKIMAILPNLAAAFSAAFVQQSNGFTSNQTFLTYTIKHYTDTINSKRDRPIAFASLGKMIKILSSYFRMLTNVSDIFSVIISGFRDPFCPQALTCLGELLNCCTPARKCIDITVIDEMFKGALSKELIETLKIVLKHVPSVREHTQARLRRRVESILQRQPVLIDEVNSSGKRTSARVNKSGSSSSAAPKETRGSIWGAGSLFGGPKPEPVVEPVLIERPEEEIIFALKVLSLPEFFPKLLRDRFTKEENQSLELLVIVSRSVLCYLDDCSVNIRKAAVGACISVLDIVVDSIDVNSSEFRAVCQLLDRLLIMGVGDENIDIRVGVFKSITPSLDHALSLTDNVHCLIEALNDECLPVRASAMTVLSRVAHYDTLHVLPMVRLVLKRLIYNLNATHDNVVKQDSVQLLQAMVKGSDELIVPYVKQVIGPLMALLTDRNADVVVAALATVGELAISSPGSVREQLDDLAPRLIDALNDASSPAKQQTAVIVMGKLVSSFAMVTEEPYKKYNGLFEGLVGAVRSTDDISSELRIQAIKTLGLLGSVDHLVYQKHLMSSNAAIKAFNVAQVDIVEERDEEDIDDLPSTDDSPKLSKIERHYFTVVVKGLMGILKDSTLTYYHQMASTTVIRTLRIIGSKGNFLLNEVMSGILFRLYQADSGNNIKDALLDHVISLIHIMGAYIKPFTPQLVQIIQDFFDAYPQLCLDIFESLSMALSNAYFTSVLQDILPTIFKALEEDYILPDSVAAEEAQLDLDTSLNSAASAAYIKSPPGSSPPAKNQNNNAYGNKTGFSERARKISVNSNSQNKTEKILQKIININQTFGEYRRDLLPILIKILDNPSVPTEVRKESLKTIMHITNQSDALEFASRIIHSLLKLLTGQDNPMFNIILTTLSCLVCRLGTGYVPFIIPVRRKLQSLQNKDSIKSPKLEEYESLVARLLKQRPLPDEPADMTELTALTDGKVRTHVNNAKPLVDQNFSINYPSLETAWALSGRNNASDLIQWMERVTMELIRQSPSLVIRSCANLTKSHYPLAEELFNSSFHCMWDELFSSQANEVIIDIPLINGIETALSSPQIPKNIMVSLLNLAEFMDMQDKPLPLDVELLARRAQDANMFAKCLRYREIQFSSMNVIPSMECIDALITVNNQLGLSDRAIGLLRYLRSTYPQFEIQPRWLEKLCRWDDAYKAYETDIQQCKQQFPDDSAVKHVRWLESELGRLRCLHALGEIEELEMRATRLRAELKSHDASSEVSAEQQKDFQTEVQLLGANAAWMLGKWDTMEEFLDGQSKQTDYTEVALERNISFYHAIFAIHNKEYEKAQTLINEARNKLAGGIGSLLSESYSRAYRAMATMQVLSEMEEVIDYKQTVQVVNMDIDTIKSISLDASDGFESAAESMKKIDKNLQVDLNAKKMALIRKWRARLKWAPKDADVYRQILAVHSMVAEPLEDLDSWLELVTLCRKEGLYSLCANVLRMLGAPIEQKRAHNASMENMLATVDSAKTNHRVLFSTFQYWWSIGEKELALSELSKYLDVCLLPEALAAKGSNNYSNNDAAKFRVRCLLKKADWMGEIQPDEVHEIMNTLMEARELAKDQYSVWHAWAVANYDQLKKVGKPDRSAPSGSAERTPRKSKTQATGMNKWTMRLNTSAGTASLLNLISMNQADQVTPYVTEAIKGFVRSIILGQGQPVANLLQDTLRLITLWFTYGTKKGVFHILETELEKVSPDNWLSVIPQLIARIHIKSVEISGMLRKLLVKVAATHPQALVCPISVALNTTDSQQKMVASEVLNEMRKHQSQLVEEATMVARELMKVAITPHELWYDGLEQAAQLYIDNKDISAMLSTLKDLHETMSDHSNVSNGDSKRVEGFSVGMGKIGWSTLRDVSFRQNYGRTLQDALLWLDQFRNTGRTIDLHQAWEIYQSVFKKIKAQITSLKRLEMHHVSPALTLAKDLILVVPGTYKPAGPDISISSFSPTIHVIASKQRPRRMALQGSDGNRYQFLLKGHEDLRQDERVMQLFGLINVCLGNDRVTSDRGLNIVRYSVLPLSNNSGVIGWVENCDTINQLVKQYREAKDIRLLLELKLLQSKCQSYDKLPLQGKVELFKQVLDETTGEDLAKMLWLKSKTSDVWIERRANFSKSLAVMSMVGYILGLGDRHPSNLMLDRVSGQVVHIDFGDCFEITAQRSKYPEIVPFRLTRMLTNCMEAAGIEGTFRMTCERVMRVLRENRYSVMAMLEAFVYDPLISWRLLTKGDASDAMATVSRSESVDDQKSPVEKAREQAASSLLDRSDLHDNGNERSPKRVLTTSSSMRDVSVLRRTMSIDLTTDAEPLQENLNARALEVINRIQAKLTGRDFIKDDEDIDDFTVAEQVDRLIKEATSIENLCQLFNGWCPLW